MGKPLEAAILAALITGPLAAYIVHLLTKNRLKMEDVLERRRQEHAVLHEGIYTRRADIISELFGLIVDAKTSFYLWLAYDDIVEQSAEELSRSSPDQHEKNQSQHEYFEQEYDVNAAYEQFLEKQDELIRFYKRKQVWFGQKTQDVLNDLVELQQKVIEAQEAMPLLTQLDDFLRASKDRESAANKRLKELKERMKERMISDSNISPEELPELEYEETTGEENAHDARDWWKQNKLYYPYAINQAHDAVYSEFQTILGVESPSPSQFSN